MGKVIEKLKEMAPTLIIISVALVIITFGAILISSVRKSQQALQKRFPTGSVVRHKIGNIQGMVLGTSAGHVRVRFVSPSAGPQEPTDCNPGELVIESEQH